VAARVGVKGLEAGHAMMEGRTCRAGRAWRGIRKDITWSAVHTGDSANEVVLPELYYIA